MTKRMAIAAMLLLGAACQKKPSDDRTQKPSAQEPASAQPAAPPPQTPRACEAEPLRADRVKDPQKRLFPTPIVPVRRAAEAALVRLDFDIRTTARGIEATRRKRHAGAGPDRVSLRIESARGRNRSGTLVTARTESGLAGKIQHKSYANAILAQIGCELSRK